MGMFTISLKSYSYRLFRNGGRTDYSYKGWEECFAYGVIYKCLSYVYILCSKTNSTNKLLVFVKVVRISILKNTFK